MKRNHLPFDRKQRFGFRKLSMGLASCFLGSVLLVGNVPSVAAETTAPQPTEANSEASKQAGSIFVQAYSATGEKIGLAELVDSSHPALPSRYSVSISQEKTHDEAGKKWVFTGRFMDTTGAEGDRTAADLTVKPIYEVKEVASEADLPVDLAATPLEIRVPAGHTITMEELKAELNKREQAAASSKTYTSVTLTDDQTVLTHDQEHQSTFTVRAAYTDPSLHGSTTDTITVHAHWTAKEEASETEDEGEIPAEFQLFVSDYNKFHEGLKTLNPDDYTAETAAAFDAKVKQLQTLVQEGTADFPTLRKALDDAVAAQKALVPKATREEPSAPSLDQMQTLQADMVKFGQDLQKLNRDLYTSDSLAVLDQKLAVLRQSLAGKSYPEIRKALDDAVAAKNALKTKVAAETPAEDNKPAEANPQQLQADIVSFFKGLEAINEEAYTPESLAAFAKTLETLTQAMTSQQPSLAAIQAAFDQAKKAHKNLIPRETTTTAPSNPNPPSSKPEVVADKHLVLHYLAPAATTYAGWEKESLPIGNGDIGSKVFGLVGGEKIQFNEKTLWSGGPKEGKPYNGGNLDDKYKILPEIRKALEDGNVAKAKQLAEKHLVGPYSPEYGRYLAFGDVTVDFVGDSKAVKDVTDYGRHLDLKTAIASTDYTYKNNQYHRESFVSYPDNVSVTHFTKTGKDKLDLNIALTPTMDLVKNHTTYDEAKKSDFKESTVTYSKDGALLKGRVKDNGLNYASFLKVDTDGTVRVENDKLSITGASYATLYLSAETDFAQDPKNGYRDKTINVENFVKETANKASQKGYAAVKESHITDYQALFNRVKLTLASEKSHKPTDQLLREYKKESGQELEELFFQYGRYLMITSSRDGKNALPANLQGVWNAVDNPPWNSDYHLNVNLQMNYWPVYSSNIAETALPLINYIDDMRHFGRVAAAEYANVVSKEGEENGWLVHTQATPFGWTTPGWSYYWGWSPASNAWIMQNVYDYYRFTKDEGYLRDKIYPMLKETAKFWNQFLHYDKASDRYVSSPSYSPEHGTITIGNTYDQSLVWQLFHDFIEAANVLKVDKELVDEITVKYNKLKPLHINAKGQIKEWFEEDSPGFTNEGVEKGHRHVSQLVGLFPGTLFSKDTPEYLEAAKASLNDRGDGGTGWSKANKINLWARLLDGNRAHRLLAEQLKGSTLTNLWDTHTPFQIDGNFGATSGITEMLLQSHSGYIAPLAALPDAWKTGEVSGLMARGNVQVDMAWANKNLTSLTLTAKKGGPIQIDYPNIETATLLINGKPANFRKVQTDRIEIDSKAGDVITLNQITGRIADLTATRQSATKALVSFSGLPQAQYYTITRSEMDETGKVLATRSFKTSETSFLDTTISDSKAYTYQVVAMTATGPMAPSNTASITPVLELFDDRDPRIQYGSAYGNWGDGDLFGGTEKFIDITGKAQSYSDQDITATIPFTGSGIEIYGLKSTQLGKALVTIDGKPVDGLDFHKAGTTEKGVLIGRYDGLTEGPHTLTIRVSKDAPTRGERNKISLDYFRVLHTKAINIEKLDDRDPRIQYGKEYKTWNDGNLYSGTETYADLDNRTVPAADATASLTFEGTGIQVYGIKSSGLGKAKVMIDGKEAPALNFFKTGDTEKGVLIGEYSNLANGSHTITIEVDPAPASQGRRKISLDYFVIQKADEQPLAPAQAEDVTVGDKELAIQLPETDWTKIEVTLPEASKPITITKAGTDITATGGTIRLADQTAFLSLPSDLKPGLIQLATFHQTETAPATIALVKPAKEDKVMTKVGTSVMAEDKPVFMEAVGTGLLTDQLPTYTLPTEEKTAVGTGVMAEDKPVFMEAVGTGLTEEDKPTLMDGLAQPAMTEDKPVFMEAVGTGLLTDQLPTYTVSDKEVLSTVGTSLITEDKPVFMDGLVQPAMAEDKPSFMDTVGTSLMAEDKPVYKLTGQASEPAKAADNKAKEEKKALPATGETGSALTLLGLAMGLLLFQEAKKRKNEMD